MTVREPRSEVGRSRPRLGMKLVAIAGAAVLAAATAATAAHGAAKSKPFCHPGSLTVTVFNFSEIPFKGALAGFRKYCPSVKVSYAIQTTSPTYQTALQTQKLSGNLTDIIETYDSLSPTLEVDGVVQPLNKYLNSKDFYPASYWLKGMSQSYIPPPGSQPKSFVGKQFFVPIEADATVFYVNIKDLAAGHFTISPSAHTSVTASGGTIGNDWTWQQAETVWSALTKGSTSGVCERPDWQAQWNPFIKAEGGTAMGATKPGLNTSAAIAAWQLLIEPEKNGSAVPFATLQKNGDQCDPSFTSGQAAMSIGVRGDLPSLQAALGPSAFNVLPMPTISTPSRDGSSDRRRQRRLGSQLRGEARQAGAGLPALLLLAARLRRGGEDVRDRSRRDEHRGRSEGRVGDAAEQPGEQRRLHASPRTASRRSRRRRPAPCTRTRRRTSRTRSRRCSAERACSRRWTASRSRRSRTTQRRSSPSRRRSTSTYPSVRMV